MKVLVLLAGIGDPKVRYGDPSSRILSPFDESALELALKMRDAVPSTTVDGWLVGSAKDDSLARNVMALRLDNVVRVECDDAWDVAKHAQVFFDLIIRLERTPDLILVGRQFGDYDDFAFAPCLSEVLSCKLVPFAQTVHVAGDKIVVTRERSGNQESLTANFPAVISVTNDKGNRLRKPLMKNMVLAKRSPVSMLDAKIDPVNNDTAQRLAVLSCGAAEAPSRSTSCRYLDGSIEERASELAAFLSVWKGQT